MYQRCRSFLSHLQKLIELFSVVVKVEGEDYWFSHRNQVGSGLFCFQPSSNLFNLLPLKQEFVQIPVFTDLKYINWKELLFPPYGQKKNQESAELTKDCIFPGTNLNVSQKCMCQHFCQHVLPWQVWLLILTCDYVYFGALGITEIKLTKLISTLLLPHFLTQELLLSRESQ